ncbi:hypothetical protein AB1K83_06885 [Sporosarcina sp. 179-K 3D1 HS]|uniref:hypothetical protein n=1 Tax=Sporosarcina sp. 179-K 3D1 HS TaxID=3232169 RepID=UPI0039A2EF53
MKKSLLATSIFYLMAALDKKKGYMNGERPKEPLMREQFTSVLMKVVADLEKE